MKSLILATTIFLLFFIANHASGQCTVEAVATPDSVCLGDSVVLKATFSCEYDIYEDFNSGAAGSGIIANSGYDFSNPCSSKPDSSLYLWMGQNATIPRLLSTVDMDASSLYALSFDLRYAIQFESSPCEGPDTYDEGVTLEYSTDGSTWPSTWHCIAYFRPDGTILNYTVYPGTDFTVISNYNTPFTIWNNYSFSIPAAARTTSTRFRWIQYTYTSVDYDHWGLDNIAFASDSNLSVVWSNGMSGTIPVVVYPDDDTSYIVVLTDSVSGTSIYDTVSIHVDTFKPEIFISGNSLVSDSIYTSYSWIDCNTGATIPGENNQSFTPLANGSYALYATSFSGCSSQSECIDFTTVNIEPLNKLSISIYPVPSENNVTISNSNSCETAYSLYDISGKLILNFKTDSPEFKLDLSGFSAGSYLLKASNNQSVQTFRMEKL